VSRHVAAVVAGAAIVAALVVGWDPPPATAVTITIRYSAFDPAAVTVRAGVPVTITLVNEDPIDHEWLVGDDAFHAAHRTGTHPVHGDVPNEVTIPALGTATTTITFDGPGRLAFICHLPAHEAYGMVGVIDVEG
jgi:uncharacterized cupredoxin-like copper-binding protein